MSKTSTKKYKYSKIQYFFWLLSGAEISILKDCPTDYNRQAGIGFTIFMTTLLAFFSGSYAGYYFGESYLSAVIFGIIWASLIFSIDRSMVVTLKKDPTKEKQNFWAAFLSRCVLAILIAFIISIPLELLIFKENIDLHMDKYKLDQVYAIQQASKRNEAIAEKKGVLIGDSLSKLEINNELAVGEPKNDPQYDLLKTNIANKQADLDRRQTNLNTAKNNENISRSKVPSVYNNFTESFEMDRSSSQYRSYQSDVTARRKAQQDFNSFNWDELNELIAEKQDRIDKWAEKLKAESDRIDSDIKDTKGKIKEGLAISDSISDGFGDEIAGKKGFVLRFMVLENLATPNNPELPEGTTIFMLLWLIRILFFTIEILPTIAKIATPIGAYDRAIYSKEKDLELELQERTSEYLKQQKTLRDIEYEAEEEQLKERTQIENNLHKELLTEIANVQNKVARQKIEEFKNKNSPM
jgi:hypothetical protein